MIKPIPNFPGYFASEDGNIFSKNKMLKPQDNSYGYKKVQITGGVQRYIHRLVAETFIGPLGKDFQVNHKDGNKSNNHVQNLEIVTPRQNVAHAQAAGYRKRDIKVLTTAEVDKIRELLNAGTKTKEIAKLFGRSQRCIQYIRQGKHVGKYGFNKS